MSGDHNQHQKPPAWDLPLIPLRPWQSLSTSQTKALWLMANKKLSLFIPLMDAKLKELNHGEKL